MTGNFLPKVALKCIELLEVAVFIMDGFNTSQGTTESSVFWGCSDKMSR